MRIMHLLHRYKTRAIIGCIFVVIILATAGLIGHADGDAPQGATYVTRLPAGGWVHPAGLITIKGEDPRVTTNATTVICRGWTGKERWRLIVPPIDRKGWKQEKRSPWNHRAFAISPDGRTVGVVGANGSSILCLAWREGKEITRCSLPIGTKAPFDRQHRFKAVVSDEGMLYLLMQDHLDTVVTAIRGREMVDRKVYRSRLTVKPGEDYVSGIAPDGRTLIGYKFLEYSVREKQTLSYPDFEYATVTVNSGKLAVQFRYTASNVAPILFCDGAVLDDLAGARFLPTGQASPSDGWETFPNDYLQGGERTCRAILQTKDKNWRVLNPATGDAWSGAQEKKPDMISISHGGQCAVVLTEDEGITVYRQPGAIDAHLPFRAKKIHHVDEYEGNKEEYDETIHYLDIKGEVIRNIGRVDLSADGKYLYVLGYSETRARQLKRSPVEEYFIFSLE